MKPAMLPLAAILAAAFMLQAQDANPISANMKQSWTNVNNLHTRMAETSASAWRT